MRRISLPISLVLLLGFARAARADCASSGLVLFPAPGSVVPTNSQLLLEGLGVDEARVNRLVGHDLVLRSEDDAVHVRVVRGWHSLVNRVAVILKPVRALRPNRLYFLDSRALGDDLRWVNGPAHGNPSWQTGETADTRPPRWVHRPEVSQGEVARRDGKVVRNVTLHVLVQDQSPSYLVVTLRPERGGTGAQVYFTPLDGAEAVIGHDGCTGSFALEDNGVYRASAQAFDITGSATSPAAFGFQSPGQRP